MISIGFVKIYDLGMINELDFRIIGLENENIFV